MMQRWGNLEGHHLNVEKARQGQVWVGEGLKSPAGGGDDKEVDPEKMILFNQDDFKDF